MVTTGQNNIGEQIASNHVFDPAELAPSDWSGILQSAKDKLTVEYLRGLVSLKVILEEVGNRRDQRGLHLRGNAENVSKRFPDLLQRRDFLMLGIVRRRKETCKARSRERFLTLRRNKHGKSVFVEVIVDWRKERMSVDHLFSFRWRASQVQIHEVADLEVLFGKVSPEILPRFGYYALDAFVLAQGQTAKQLAERTVNASTAMGELLTYLSRIREPERLIR